MLNVADGCARIATIGSLQAARHGLLKLNIRKVLALRSPNAV